MERGRLLFELSFADTDFNVPVIRTLIDLGSVEFVDNEEMYCFLHVDELIRPGKALKIVALSASQAEGLLDRRDLVEKLLRVSSDFSVDKLNSLGL